MSQEKINFQNILRFVEFLNKFRLVTRDLLANGTDRFENDVEHSYMLTMLADYIISTDNLSLDRHKVMMYCLVHDMLETYAGDTAFFADESRRNSKHDREVQSLQRIESEFSEYKDLISIIKEYEDKSNEEAKFVYALDKICPSIQIYLDGGKWFKESGLTLEALKENKHSKVSVSPIVEKYWEEFLKILNENRTELFPN